MVLPASGPISLQNINTELGRTSTATIGLQQAETGVYGAINQNSAQRPDGVAPHSMNEWYGYDHSASAVTATGGWNPSDNGGITLSNGNLTATRSAGGWRSVRGVNFYNSGIFSFEVQTNSVNTLVGFGASNASLLTYTGQTANSIGYWGNLSGRIYRNSGNDVARNFGGYSTAIIKCEINFSTDIVSFYRDGTLMWSGASGRDGLAVAAMVSLENGASVTLLN
jgi:hypothetical protein